MTIDQLLSKRIGILGWGVNHQAMVHWLVRHGATQVTILDEAEGQADETIAGVRWQFGASAFDSLTDYDILIRSPGILPDHPKLQAVRAAGVTISSQTQLFFDRCPARIIGVTGTKGKGTTASIIFQMLEAEGKRQKAKGKSFNQVYLAGNIGRDPFEFLDQLTADDWVVLELSSFQLEDLTSSPHIAVVLAIGEDHLDHHRSLTEYHTAKRSIVAYQRPTDYAILSADDPVSRSFAALTPATKRWFSRRKDVIDGVDIADDQDMPAFQLIQAGQQTPIVATAELQLRGWHNQVNMAAALAAAHQAGVSLATMATVARSFQPLPNRLETVAIIHGVSFVNDSYATAPQPTIAALDAFDRPIVLILGGRGKGANYQSLAKALAAANLRALVCYGEEGERFQTLQTSEQNRQIVYERMFDDAVRRAADFAQAGDVVLLSPSATSYDQFRNYTQRGDRFRQLVAEIARIKNQESRIK